MLRANKTASDIIKKVLFKWQKRGREPKDLFQNNNNNNNQSSGVYLF
jgi:hypothetical protein